MQQHRNKLIATFLHYNAQINLSAIRDEQGIYHKHIQDSLELTKFDIIKKGDKVIDVGTGGGFPLMPLAMHYPDAQFTGIDARQKKAKVVNQIIQEVGISNAQALWTRAEDHNKHYDVMVSRAVAYVDKLLHWSHHLVKQGGYFVLYKLNVPEERKKLEQVCETLDLIVAFSHHYSLFDGDIDRVIYIIKKPEDA